MKKIYLYGNWKMNMTRAETEVFYRDFAALVSASPELAGVMGKTLEVAVFPPFTSLCAAENAIGGMGAAAPILGAQNAFFAPSGAFTGEVSLSMLEEAGCRRVIVGHSERRALFGESDETIAKKVAAVLDCGLTPVFCYGETLAERAAGRAFEVAGRQLRSALSELENDKIEKIVFAYEPVWAIGTGKSATAAEAQEVCAWSKDFIRGLAGKALSVVLLYGGSVNPQNAGELLSMEAIDGALVGGASLKADSFLRIYTAYAGI